jgi:hypothetical protein
MDFGESQILGGKFISWNEKFISCTKYLFRGYKIYFVDIKNQGMGFIRYKNIEKPKPRGIVHIAQKTSRFYPVIL